MHSIYFNLVLFSHYGLLYHYHFMCSVCFKQSYFVICSYCFRLCTTQPYFNLVLFSHNGLLYRYHFMCTVYFRLFTTQPDFNVYPLFFTLYAVVLLSVLHQMFLMFISCHCHSFILYADVLVFVLHRLCECFELFSMTLNGSIENYYGLVKATVYPPRKLLHPVLLFRCSGKLMFPLCHTCAQSENQTTSCNYTDVERSLTGCWVSIELLKAINKGYVVDRIYEVWHFRNNRIRYSFIM